MAGRYMDDSSGGIASSIRTLYLKCEVVQCLLNSVPPTPFRKLRKQLCFHEQFWLLPFLIFQSLSLPSHGSRRTWALMKHASPRRPGAWFASFWMRTVTPCSLLGSMLTGRVGNTWMTRKCLLLPQIPILSWGMFVLLISKYIIAITLERIGMGLMAGKLFFFLLRCKSVEELIRNTPSWYTGSVVMFQLAQLHHHILNFH